MMNDHQLKAYDVNVKGNFQRIPILVTGATNWTLQMYDSLGQAENLFENDTMNHLLTLRMNGCNK